MNKAAWKGVAFVAVLLATSNAVGQSNHSDEVQTWFCARRAGLVPTRHTDLR